MNFIVVTEVPGSGVTWFRYFKNTTKEEIINNTENILKIIEDQVIEIDEW